MKKFIFIIIATLIISPKNASAQNNNAAGIATAVGGLMAIGAAIATIENMKERAELVATEFILTNNPELQNFSLKTLDFDGKKLKDMSSVSVNLICS